MNFKTLLLCVLAAMAVSEKANALPEDHFVRSSCLSEGKWVKVGIPESGVYEIPYITLRRMGFTNPAEVAVFGHGGKMLPEQFTNEKGQPLFADDLSPVRVLHVPGDGEYDGKLIFYGQGPESISFSSNLLYSETGGLFKRDNLNLYSSLGYYFLSDSASPLEMTRYPDVTPDRVYDINIALDYLYHEQDLYHNNSGAGRLFWGESFMGKSPQDKVYREWSYKLPRLNTKRKGVMECIFYSAQSNKGVFGYGIKDSPEAFSDSLAISATSIFKPLTPSNKIMSIPSRDVTIFVKHDARPDRNPSIDAAEIGNLDYWMLTYAIDPAETDYSAAGSLIQDRYTFPRIYSGSAGYLTVKGLGDKLAFDITDPETPYLITPDSRERMLVKNLTGIPSVVVFDPSQKQKRVAYMEAISNQDLHAKASAGADLLIITVPKLRAQAERLAAIHRKYDGIEVIVAEPEEIYNEFSSGMPDPMAYRSLAKMLYSNAQRPLKNILLAGPQRANIRGLGGQEAEDFSAIISYQVNENSITKPASNCNDFYGMMADYNSESSIQRYGVHVGVGSLPCDSEHEFDTYINKIENYYNDTSLAYRLNSFMNVGGTGDEHTHAHQSVEIGHYLNSQFDNNITNTTLVIDAYAGRDATQRFINGINEGRNFVIYFGHGHGTAINHATNFFTSGEVKKMVNEALPFMCFAGCSLTNADRGKRGIGEQMLLATSHGLIGSILASRESWSGQNMDFYQLLFRNMAESAKRDAGKSPLTIGEIYAATKSESMVSNELAYQLECDPALRVVVPSLRIDIKDMPSHITPGERITVSGHILDRNVKPIDDFNGEVVLKLLAPPVTLESNNYNTYDKDKIDVTYDDEVMTLSAAEVVDGKFDITFTVPYELRDRISENAGISVAAYDPSARLGAAVKTSAMVAAGNSQKTPSDDNPPIIENFAYDAASRSIRITVSDDKALLMSNSAFSEGLTLSVDNRIIAAATVSQPILEHSRSAYSKNVLLEDLTYGQHYAFLTVKDAAGNESQASLTFEVAPLRGAFTLALSGKAAAGRASFTLEGAPAGADLTLNILDLKGNLVYSGKRTGTHFDWNLTDNDGKDVPPGIYKAYVLQNNAGENDAYSQPVDVPVI